MIGCKQAPGDNQDYFDQDDQSLWKGILKSYAIKYNMLI